MMRLTRLRAQLELVVTRLQKDKAAFEAYKVRFRNLLSNSRGSAASSACCQLGTSVEHTPANGRIEHYHHAQYSVSWSCTSQRCT